MISKKFGKQLNKEGKNPCVYFINKNDICASSILKKRNLQEINTNNIIFDTQSYNSPISIKNEQYTMPNCEKIPCPRKYLDIVSISSNNNFNIDKDREDSLNDILNYQYEKFIKSKDISILDNIAKIKKIKNNI